MKRSAALWLMLTFATPASAAAQVLTSTTPRARMPEGGVPLVIDGQEAVRSTPEGGVDDGLPRARTPLDGAGPIPAGRQLTVEAAKGPTRKFGDYSEQVATSGLKIGWNGFLRLVIEAIENDDDVASVGRNDGFKLASARMGLRVEQGDLLAYLSLDAALGEREFFEDPDQTFGFRPRDLLLRYRLAEFASVTVGRFKTPYDLGQLEVTVYRLFIDRPLESRGVLPLQGVAVEGLGQGRQLGAMIHRDRLGLDPDGFDFGYALAITNGRAVGVALNDNDRVAGFGRLSLYWADIATLNVAGFFDNRTVIEGDAVDADVRGVEVSLLLQGFGFSVEGQLLFQGTTFDGTERADVDAWGGHAQVAYDYHGLQVAYRFAHFVPVDSSRSVSEHTVGVGYLLQSLPLRFLLNGTITPEATAVRADNNRLALLTQLSF